MPKQAWPQYRIHYRSFHLTSGWRRRFRPAVGYSTLVGWSPVNRNDFNRSILSLVSDYFYRAECCTLCPDQRRIDRLGPWWNVRPVYTWLKFRTFRPRDVANTRPFGAGGRFTGKVFGTRADQSVRLLVCFIMTFTPFAENRRSRKRLIKKKQHFFFHLTPEPQHINHNFKQFTRTRYSVKFQ